MTIQERNKIVDELLENCKEVLIHKGIAYSGEIDANSNFKRNAKLLGVTKYQVLAVYLNKHLDGIINAIKANPDFPEEKTEGMYGRITDAINYLTILYSLIVEDKQNVGKKR